MTKRSKKTEAVKRVYENGIYTVRFMPDVDGVARFRSLKVDGGFVVEEDGEEAILPLHTVDSYIAINGGGADGVHNGNILISLDAQKNTPEAAATATEADLKPREENQTTLSIAKKQNIRKPVLRVLRFDLSMDEIEAKCSGISKKTRARAELEAEFARVRTDYKGRIERMSSEIIADLRAVEDRAEHREVECDEVHDFESRMVGFEFEGEIYEQREMTPSERQMTFEEVF